MKTKFFFHLSIVTILVALTMVIFFNAPHNAQARAKTLANPSNFRVTNTTDTSVSLAWDSVPGANIYSVVKWETGDNWVKLTDTSATTYTDNSLNCNNSTVDYGDYYKIIAYDTDTNETSETGWLPGAPLNDNFSKAVDITMVPSTEKLFTCNANSTEWMDDPEVTNCNLGRGIATVWYTYTANSDGAIAFDTTGTDYDSFIAIWTGDQTNYNNGTLTSIACNNDTSVAFQATSGKIYYIEIGQYKDTQNTSATSFEFVGPPLHEQIR